MKDLFGEEITAVDDKRKKNDIAHPAPPGSGPVGKTCRTCVNLRYHEKSNRYYKCGKMKMSGGPATDIRMKDSACSFYREGDR